MSEKDIEELSILDPQYPLLKEFREKAPGTLNHSKSVATLVENAACSIGIDAVNLKIAALYHDIGKMLAPNFFTENQKENNPHDDLDSLISYLIITKHVSDSVLILTINNFPQKVIRIVSEHHGTNILKYFYEKSKKTSSNFKPTDFRYYTPRPTCLESLILMLCDHIEATTRSLFINKKIQNDDFKPEILVDNVFSLLESDKQFDLVEVKAYGDLRKVKESIITDIGSIYHNRISYPNDSKLIEEKNNFKDGETS